jgi:hypothetical protein
MAAGGEVGHGNSPCNTLPALSSSYLVICIISHFFGPTKLQSVMPVTEVLALFWQETQRPEHG